MPGQIDGKAIRMNDMRQGFHPCDAELARGDRCPRPLPMPLGVLIARLCAATATRGGIVYSFAILCHGASFALEQPNFFPACIDDREHLRCLSAVPNPEDRQFHEGRRVQMWRPSGSMTFIGRPAHAAALTRATSCRAKSVGELLSRSLPLAHAIERECDQRSSRPPEQLDQKLHLLGGSMFPRFQVPQDPP